MRFFLLVFTACVPQVPDTPDARVPDASPQSHEPFTPGAWTLPARIRVTSDVGHLDAWRAEVEFHVGQFIFATRAVSPTCPAMFELADDGDHEARLTRDCDGLEWGMSGGQSAADRLIVIRGVATLDGNYYRSVLRGTVIHELGHAVGLVHADPYDGPSAMTVPPEQLMQHRDAQAVACVLGCGPC